jgi:integrase
MARKKKNNIVCKRGNYYYRIRVFLRKEVSDEGVERIFQKEKNQKLFTKDKAKAIRRGKLFDKHIDDIKSGVIQEYQFKELFPFMNDEGRSVLIKKSLQDTINEYLEYRCEMVKPATLKRDKSALNQLMNFIGQTKAVEDLSYKDIEGKNGLIQHLRSKGCTNVGINTSLRHIRTYVNWLYEKEKIIPERIKFKELKKGMQLYHYFNESETSQVYHYIEENIDSAFLRYYHFYNQTGMRPTEPFIGELVGDWYLIPPELRKNGIPMQMQLDDELKSILLEMQSFRDTKLHCKDANVRVVDILERTIMKIVRSLGFTGKRLTLYSFRHAYGIRRITMTNGNIHQVMREMGHSNTQTTMEYLRFPEQRRLDDFPSLREYIQQHQNIPKNTIRGTKGRGTLYDNVNKLSRSSTT